MPRFNHFKTYLPQVNRPYMRIARIIEAIIASHITEDGRIDNVEQMERELGRYGQSLTRWAQEFWQELLNRQNNQLKRDWNHAGLKITADWQIRETISNLAAESVHLIKTLPLNAAQVAQRMAREAAMNTGERAASLIGQIQGLQAWYPEYAARRLARTEIAKAQSDLVQAQAQSVGVTHYVWRTVGDGSVRDAHAELDGLVFAFDNPPYIEGEGYHGPGQVWNCRCYASPILTNSSGMGIGYDENELEYAGNEITQQRLLR